MKTSIRSQLSNQIICIFLSCLRGSEQDQILNDHDVKFLSCLRGSERIIGCVPHTQTFLSCLRGSEPKAPTPSAIASVSKLPTRQ